MIIDGHIHIGRWSYRHYSSLSVDVTGLDGLLDTCGIDGAVLFPSDIRDNQSLLDQIKKTGKKKYWFFPWVNPKEKGWEDFIVGNIGSISGIKVHSSLDKIMGGITNRVYEPLLEFAAAKGLIMYVHCGRWQEASSYAFVLDMAKKYKKTIFIIAHLGGDHEELKLKAPAELKESRLTNVFIDISATREFWAIEAGVKLLGAGRFLFGSDYPVMHPKVALECVNVLNITDKDKRMILGENIVGILQNNRRGRG